MKSRTIDTSPNMGEPVLGLLLGRASKRPTNALVQAHAARAIGYSPRPVSRSQTNRLSRRIAIERLQARACGVGDGNLGDHLNGANSRLGQVVGARCSGRGRRKSGPGGNPALPQST
jgi:hypothetical protein